MSATDVTFDPLVIAGRELRSRLLLGTGGFRSLEAIAEAIGASGTELVTVALRRIDPDARGSIVDVLESAGVQLLPNTARCYPTRRRCSTRPRSSSTPASSCSRTPTTIRSWPAGSRTWAAPL